jgi:hypothetical protein
VNVSERIWHLTAARRRILVVLSVPESLEAPLVCLAKQARVSRTTLWQALRDPEFLALLRRIRAGKLGITRSELALRIAHDALQPLADVPRHAQKALLESRRMAVAFLSLPIDILRPSEAHFQGMRGTKRRVR